MHFYPGTGKYKIFHKRPLNGFFFFAIGFRTTDYFDWALSWKEFFALGWLGWKAFCFVCFVVFFLSVLYVAGLRDSRESGSVDPGHQSGRILISSFVHTPIKKPVHCVEFLVFKICNIQWRFFFTVDSPTSCYQGPKDSTVEIVSRFLAVLCGVWLYSGGLRSVCTCTHEMFMATYLSVFCV